MREALTYPAPVPDRWCGGVVAIGNFDGVHAGHRALLAAARVQAGAQGTVLALTFDPHPRSIVRLDVAHVPLMTLPERVQALHAAGVDGVAVLPFDAVVAGWSPEMFVQTILRDWLAVAAVCVGENFRFGARAAGNPTWLAQCPDFATTVVPLLTDADGIAFSSTRLRGQPRDVRG